CRGEQAWGHRMSRERWPARCERELVLHGEGRELIQDRRRPGDDVQRLHTSILGGGCGKLYWRVQPRQPIRPPEGQRFRRGVVYIRLPARQYTRTGSLSIQPPRNQKNFRERRSCSWHI